MNNLERLRHIMDEAGIDIYIDKISDPHLNEFVDDYFNTVKALTNFTGDTASLIVTKKDAYLIVDSRFTIQAKCEVDQKYIKILTVTSTKLVIESKIKEIFSKNKTGSIYDTKVVFFDYEKFSINLAKQIIDVTKKVGGTVFGIDYFYFKNLPINKISKLSANALLKETRNIFEKIRKINKHRFPRLKDTYPLSEKVVGLSTKEKISKIVSYMRKSSCDLFILSKLDEIAYITNKRGSDFPCDPLFYSYLVIDNKGKYKLFSKSTYNNFYSFLSKINKKRVLIDYISSNYKIYHTLKENNNELKDTKGIVKEAKSIKTTSEIINQKKAMLIESAVLCDVIYNLKSKNFSKEKMTEYDISKLIDKKRKIYAKKFGSKYISNSFDTIAAYNENAAMAHYKPLKNKSKVLKNSGILLIDTGANYLYGTTDTTRTIALGKVSSIEKKHFTIVLDAMLKLSNHKFKKGTRSKDLDKISRSILLKNNMDYGHSTGHGIGFLSCVHEGPNSFSPISEYIIKEHQIFSVEPGYYVENKYGIRIENILLSTKASNMSKMVDLLGFETLTFVPVDKDMIDKKYLTKKSIELLNNYTESIIINLKNYLPKKIISYIESLII